VLKFEPAASKERYFPQARILRGWEAYRQKGGGGNLWFPKVEFAPRRRGEFVLSRAGSRAMVKDTAVVRNYLKKGSL